jgi:hypothetical protein
MRRSTESPLRRRAGVGKSAQRNFAGGVDLIMIRTIKFICAVGCFISALFPGGLALLVFSRLGGKETLLILCIASILLAMAAGLVWAGSHLLARLELPMSRKDKVLIPLVVLTSIGMLVAIAVPNFIKARATSSGNPCINNLRQIDAAANRFALEHNLTNGAPINFPNDLTPYIKLNSAGSIPPCPAVGVYHISKVGEEPTCTLSTATPPHKLP